MKTKIELEIDLEEITKKVIEDNNLKYNLESETTSEIRRQIECCIVSDIKKHINLDEIANETYGKNYLTVQAKKICDETVIPKLQKLVEDVLVVRTPNYNDNI